MHCNCILPGDQARAVDKDYTMSKSPKKATARRANHKSTQAARGNKTAKIVALLKRKDGATREQVLKACGWKAISMQQVAEKAHVKLRVDRKARPFVYKVA